jgi:hypothetical protein
MPGPEATDRERLLRLIDGGPDVVRELQAERAAEAPKAPVAEPRPAPAPLAAAPAPAASPKPRLSEKQKVRLAQAALAAMVAVFAIWSLTGALKNVPKTAPPSQEVPAGGVDSLRLVGVDWAERPVALLEDKVSGKTYFVKKNDTVLGARVKDIQKDHVTVSFRGKAVELR